MTPEAMIEEAAQVFLAPIEGEFWEEYGISEVDAERGARELLVHLGLLTRQQVFEIECREQNQRTLDRWVWRKLEEERRAKLSPEDRTMEDMLNRSMAASNRLYESMILNNLVKSANFFERILDQEASAG